MMMNEINLTQALNRLSPYTIVHQCAKLSASEEESVMTNIGIMSDKFRNDDKAILNGVLIYVLRVKKEKLPGLKYLLKSYYSFTKNKINTADKIVDHIKSRITHEQDVASGKTKKSQNAFNKNN